MNTHEKPIRQVNPQLNIPTAYGTLYAKVSDDVNNPALYIGIIVPHPTTGTPCELPAMMMEINTEDETPKLQAHMWPIDASSDEFWDEPKTTLSISMKKFIENQFSEE